MHDGKGLRLKLGATGKQPLRLWGVGQIAGQWALLHLPHASKRWADQIVGDHGQA